MSFRINHYIRHYFLDTPLLQLVDIKRHLINVMKWGFFLNIDAPLSFKEKYVHAEQEDTILVKTTVDLHGRVIKNPFSELISDDKKVKIKNCIDCLKNCSYRFCTLDSLINIYEWRLREWSCFCRIKST